MPENGCAYGPLIVYHGCMFSSKSDQLYREYDIARVASLEIQAFKPRRDTRDGDDRIKTRRGQLWIPAISVDCEDEILQHFCPTTKLVLMDEIQFFKQRIISIIHRIRFQGTRVVVAGLDLTFLAQVFGHTLELAAHATESHKLTAVCTKCRAYGAQYSQLIDFRTGEPVTSWDPDKEMILIESPEARYEARCGRCFAWPTPVEKPKEYAFA